MSNSTRDKSAVLWSVMGLAFGTIGMSGMSIMSFVLLVGGFLMALVGLARLRPTGRRLVDWPVAVGLAAAPFWVIMLVWME